MKTRDRLSLNNACCQIAYSHGLIKTTCEEGWERKRALADWRLEIFDFINTLTKEKREFILKYFKTEDQVIYLELLTMLTDLRYECKSTFTFKNNSVLRIIKYITTLIKKENKNEKICTNSPIRIGRDSNISR